jgi:hypothetical protein
MRTVSRPAFWPSVYISAAVVGALLFGFSAFSAHEREQAFEVRGVMTDALPVKDVTEHATADRNSGAVSHTWASADLSFHTEDGETHTVTRGLDARQLEAVRSGRLLRVEYLREQPETSARLAGRHEEPLVSLTFAATLALMGWVLRRRA